MAKTKQDTRDRIQAIEKARREEAYRDDIEAQEFLRNRVFVDRRSHIEVKVVTDDVGRIKQYQAQSWLMQLRDLGELTANQYNLALRLFEATAKLEPHTPSSSLELAGRDCFNNEPDDAGDVKDRARNVIKNYLSYCHTSIERSTISKWVYYAGMSETTIDLNNRGTWWNLGNLVMVLSRMEK